jgi:2-phospho-L-lactate/phosphoenolpyruvate guanylyltransferase
VSSNSLAIIPVRSLTTGKSRLAATVPPAVRRDLTKRMLAITLSACRSSAVIDQILVISPDLDALAFAYALDHEVIAVRQNAQTPGLIPALDQARRVSIVNRFETMLVLFADLPLVNGDDVAEFVSTAGQIVIAPDQNRVGTNGLLLRRGDVDLSDFGFRFGEDSFAAHVDEARRLGIEPATVTLPGLGFDLDTPDDLGNLVTLDVGFMSRLRDTGT